MSIFVSSNPPYDLSIHVWLKAVNIYTRPLEFIADRWYSYSFILSKYLKLSHIPTV